MPKKKAKTAKKYDDIDEEVCFVCSVTLTKSSTELHHFPITKRCDGDMVIPLCTPCHDMIDRVPLEKWPVDWAFKALQGQNREGKLFLMKAVSKFWR